MEVKDKLKVYVERYCTKHGLTVEEAMKHELIKEVQKYYEREGQK